MGIVYFWSRDALGAIGGGLRNTFLLVQNYVGRVSVIVDVFGQRRFLRDTLEVKSLPGNSVNRHINQQAQQQSDHDEGNLCLAYKLVVGVGAERITHKIQAAKRSKAQFC